MRVPRSVRWMRRRMRRVQLRRWRSLLVRISLCLLAAFVLLAGWRARLTHPDPTYLVRDRQGRHLGETGVPADGACGYWPLKPLPPRVVAATTAIEDRRFAHHPGVDPFAVGRALRDNLRQGRRVSGASTLAMQVARIQNPGPRGYLRKLLEATSALLMTALYGRDAVLAQYLTIVPYGNRIHGIAYAARRYLDKPVEDLSWAETAFLTAIPQSPARMNPFDPVGRGRAVRRGQRILTELRKREILTPAEYALANSQIEDLAIPPAGERPREALHALLRLEKELTGDRGLAGRPIVHATLDLDVQKDIAYEVFRAVLAWEARGARNAAAVVLDRQTNAVLAWVGSAGYFDHQRKGAIDYAEVPRSPGSALKPFLYALALDRGVLTPATVLEDLERGAGGITNADDRFLGPMLPRVALANSRNVPAADLVARTGIDQTYDFLRDLGLHEGREPARRYGLGLAIGGLPVTLADLVRAYSALARDGRLGPLVWYDGQVPTEPRRVLSEDSARQVALFLSDPMARLPGFPRMSAVEYPFPVAVKTGTSSRFRDAWALAFSSRHVVGVWVGDPDFQPMNHLTGSVCAAELVHRILVTLHRDETQGLDDVPFPPPRGFTPTRLCGLSGRLATSLCDRVVLEWLAPGDVPLDDCPAHVRLAVDTRTGLRATSRTPRSLVELRTFVTLPPRLAEWAAHAGLAAPPPEAEAARIAEIRQELRKATAARLSIAAPRNDLRLLLDPETPPEMATLALRATVEPTVPQVVWYVNGRPFATVDPPYATRWPLQRGDHTIEVRLPFSSTTSGSVRIHVE